VPYIKVPEDVLLARLAGRWTCRKCGAMYHQLYSPPQQAGVCDRCGGELYQRSDDTPETQQHRIQVYFEQTAPLIDYYRKKGLLVEVDGRFGIDEIQPSCWASCRVMITLKSEHELVLMREAAGSSPRCWLRFRRQWLLA